MTFRDDATTWSLLDPRAEHPAYTGGHYSLVRFTVGVLLALFLFRLAPTVAASSYLHMTDVEASGMTRYFPNIFAANPTPKWAAAVVLFAAMMSVLLAIGWYDRFAALVLWYVLVCMQIRNPVAEFMPYIGWMLLIHALMPPQPFGSFGSRGRVDPRGGWYMPMPLYISAWYFLALGYALTGIGHLANTDWCSGAVLAGFLRSDTLVRFPAISHWAQGMPDQFFRALAWIIALAEVAFPVMALSRTLRPVVWAWTLVVHQAILLSIVYDRTNIGMVALHLLCFDPAWIMPRRAGRDVVLYDGNCGLCHMLVRFVLAEDRRGAFRFSPLSSDQQPANTIIVRTEGGRELVRSTAVIHILHGLGGIWAIFADLLTLLPRFLRDVAYRFVAAVRRFLFRRPKETCPMLPDDLRQRFF